MAKLFRAFPASGRVDADTIRDYCEAVDAYPAETVSRVVDLFRSGGVSRNHTFAPSIPEVVAAMRSTGMSVDERAEYVKLNANKSPLKLVAGSKND